MADLNRNLPRVDASRFSMVPRADIPRATFITEHSLKSTFHSGYLIPILVDEVLPGDVHRGTVTIFARLATPVFPVMDHMTMETFFFFAPCRLLWVNWKKFMGERSNPSDSISYTIPLMENRVNGYDPSTIYDYFGLPLVGQVTSGQGVAVNALPLRAYNLIWNEWFRDQNLQSSVTVDTDDGPDSDNNYTKLRRNKKHDYFTSALPWPLKGGVEVSIPLSGTARVATTGADNEPITVWSTVGGGYRRFDGSPALLDIAGGFPSPDADLYADLSTATGAAINALRLAFQTQKLLERDARGGTRYTELLRSHFGVTPEDQRLQRPEYIGGGRSSIQTQAIAQTSATGLTGGTSQLGSLGAAATVSDQHSYSYHATEHGYIIGLVHVTGEITYQQGLHRLWTRSTRYDFYWPAFAHLGEQAIRNDEIYCTGTDATDTATFGYQERWAEYRHRPSRITGLFRTTSAGNIGDAGWHLAQEFSALPVLNSAFIADTPPFERVIAAGAAADNMQILFDSVFRIRTTRAMPMFSVPGQIDRF